MNFYKRPTMKNVNMCKCVLSLYRFTRECAYIKEKYSKKIATNHFVRYAVYTKSIALYTVLRVGKTYGNSLYNYVI